MRTTIPALLPVLLLALAAAPAGADAVFEATLSGELSGTPSTATGHAVLVLDEDAMLVAYEVVVSGLTSPETAAHIHRGAPGQTGPQLHQLPLGPIKTGTWAVTAAEVDALHAGGVYLNIHTEGYLLGEIRGNVAFASVPARPTAWGAVRALYR